GQAGNHGGLRIEPAHVPETGDEHSPLHALHEIGRARATRAARELVHLRLAGWRFVLLRGPVARVRESCELAAVDPGNRPYRQPLLVEWHPRRFGARRIGSQADVLSEQALSEPVTASRPGKERARFVGASRVEGFNEKPKQTADRRRLEN